MASSNSADRILSILSLFTEERLEWTPEAMMEELGYSRPTLYRYLKSLKEAGLLVSMPNSGFTLGPRVVELDFLMRKSDPLILHGEPHLERLSSAWPCSALLVRWYGNKLLCVSSRRSTRDNITSYPRGRPMPLARGAISRAILAFLPRRQLLPMIEENLSELSRIGLGDTAEAITANLRQIRRKGVAVAHGEVTPGVVGIAAPVFDAGQAPIATFSITISADLANDQTISEISSTVLASANEISSKLGGRHDAET